MSQYLGTLRYLLVAGSDGSSTVHPAGSHVYPFAFQLQDTVPSSFEGSRGYVRYFCKATIDRPWKFDSSNLRAFTVIHHFDLNRFPNVVVIIQSTLVISKSKGPSKTVRDIRTSTYQICSIEENTI